MHTEDMDPGTQLERKEKMWELEKCSMIWAVPHSEEGNKVQGGETPPSQSNIQTKNFWNDISGGIYTSTWMWP